MKTLNQIIKESKKYYVEENDSWKKDPELLRLTRKAMSAMSGSQVQKELIKKLNVLRKKHGLKPLDEEGRCWKGYEPVPGKEPYSDDSCRKIEEEICPNCGEDPCCCEMSCEEKELNKPIRTPGETKKFKVYVKDTETGNIKTVRFGDPDMEIKRDDDERRKSFRARHNCDQKTDKTTPGYWSCKFWEKGKSVSDLLDSTEYDTLDEVSPPGEKYEKWILANKKRFIDQYGKEKGLAILYAKAWKMKNQGTYD